MSNIVPAVSGRMPVTLVTGYLGSGKTTLLNRLLPTPAFAHATVVINEFGDSPLDPLFVEKTDTEVTVMQNRCLCCEVQEDMAGVIGRLFGRRMSRLIAFERMVIETSGIADPAPIVQVLLGEPVVSENFRLDSVVTVVDAANILRQMQEHEEAWRQVMLADRIVIAKADLCDEAQLAALERRLGELNPDAKRVQALRGDVPPGWILGAGAGDEEAMRRRLERMREREAEEGRAPVGRRHKEGVFALRLGCEAALDGGALVRWLNEVRLAHGERLLRMKGIAELKGEKMPAGLHGVHRVFHTPQPLPHLEGWKGTSLVLILRDADPAAIGAGWDAFVKGQTAEARTA